MYSGAGVAGRTRSRRAVTEKQDFEKSSKRRKRNEGEESASHYAREEGCSIDPRFDDDDDDVMFIGERHVVNTLNHDDLSVSEDGDDDTTSDDDDEKEVVFTSSRCIARRTRSHFAPSKFRNSKAGTFSNPLCVDDEEEENDDKEEYETFNNPHYVDDEEEENDEKDEYETFSDPLCVDDEKEESETVINHNKQGTHDFDAVKDLLESLCVEEEVPRENFASSSDEEENPKVSKTYLPSRSTFGTKVSQRPEKSEDEKGLDEIWAEMDECLRFCEDSVRVETGNCDDPCPEDEVSTANPCQRGEHYPFLSHFDAVKIIQESLCVGEEAPLENFTSSSDAEGNPKVNKTYLPSKPTFGTKVSQPPEKSGDKKGLDEIWAEMDDCLRACEDSVQVETGNCDDPCPKDEVSTANPCQRGEYDPFLNDFDAVKILQESLCVEEEVPRENFTSSNDAEGNPEVTKTCLPMKSTFETRVSQPLEESEHEKGLDEIWAEMDESLYLGVEMGHCDDPCLEDEVSRATPCQRGEHDPFLNEEIGVICRNCLQVIVEIKYHDPQFCKNPWGKSGNRRPYTLEDADHPVIDDLPHQIFGCDDDSSVFDPNTSTGTVWDIIPGLKKSMFPHQREAFEFLWTNLAGGTVLDKLKKPLDFASGNGCIISHAPGTGKTFLTIVFLQAFMELYPNCRPIIIAPSNILHTWEKELEKWKVGVPFHNLNKSGYSGKESEHAMNLVRQRGRHVRRHMLHNKDKIRQVKLCSWKDIRSILGISYTLFDQLVRKSSYDIKKDLLELPGLLVLDEGHTPRNARSLIWKALSEIKTKRRIILSGTPFQNNFYELHNTLCLARGNEIKGNLEYLLKSYAKVESDTEKNKIVAEIRNMIKPFVHVHKGTVLKESLPGLRELVVRLKPSELQKKAFEYIQDTRENQLQDWLKLEYLESLATVHPALCVSEYKNLLEGERVNLAYGVKTIFVMELIRLSELMKEKVLVFSQYIVPLTFLANQIKSCFNWIEGKEMVVIHGKTHEETRQASIDEFNDPTSKVRVMLASTKACFEGIDLVGASRVVLLDILWNPSAERQAVCRAYRIGQKKVVYTYRLITSGSRDEQKCCRQAEKDQLSESVFYCPNGAGHQNVSSVDFEDKILEKMVQNDKLTHIFEKITTNGGVSFLLESAE